MIIRTLFLAATVSCLALSAQAKPSFNQVSNCQATTEFIVERTIELESSYAAADVEIVLAALTAYSAFLQAEHVTPGLSELNGADTAKMAAMQAQIDQYHGGLKAALAQKFSAPRLFSEYAMMINNCYTEAPMDADATATMKTALQILIRMAAQN